MVSNKEFHLIYSHEFVIYYIWIAHKSQNPNWSGATWNFIKFEIKKEVRKRGKQPLREAGFSK